MKKFVLVLLLTMACFALLNAAGVVINKDNVYLSTTYLKQCAYQADIQNQIAVVTVKDVFQNNLTTNVNPRYYYPVPEGASPTQLRWRVHGTWYTANIAGVPQNPQGGPGNLPATFVNYVGAFPVVFDLNTILSPSDSLIVELSYVQLLPYSFGSVDMVLRNDYSPIQYTPLQVQSLAINLVSDNEILSFSLPGVNAETSVSTHTASAAYQAVNTQAAVNYHLQYSLAQNSLALTSMSGVFDDLPDELGNGVFTFIAEPDNTQSEYISKNFTFIIDRSGSMSGSKMTQAKAAATYIVNNLNPGDSFNLIAFNDQVIQLSTSLMHYNPSNQQSALTFINSLSASGMTSISSVFSAAIPQFIGTEPNSANIIIFFTDGQPTAGIVNTTELINHVHTLVTAAETTLYLFNFGIGGDVNAPLLTALAQDNNGQAEFLGNNDLETSITTFYNLIRYPVMLSPTLTVSPMGAISEVYPNPLPNLYRGKQLIISGRYYTPQPLNLTFSGLVYGQPVNYPYATTLSSTLTPGMEFLPKIWAKQKIESLLQQYYSFDPNSSQALALRQQIINISISYGVVCIFTSFSGGVDNEDEVNTPPAAEIVLLGNYPNPFNPSTVIRFEVKSELQGPAFIRIYNIKGQLIKTLGLHVNRAGEYEILWDGKDEDGRIAASGMYYYTISIGKYLLSGKMTMLK